MVLSMTGFSSSITDIGTMHLTMTLKSLNARFFEVNCKLPYLLTHLEPDIIKLCKSSLYRGNVHCNIYIANPHSFTTAIKPSMTTIAGYIEAIQKIKKEFNLEGKCTLSDILQLPNIFETQENDLLDKTTAQAIMDAVAQLIEALNQSRLQEGCLLSKDLLERISLISCYIEKLEPQALLLLQERKNNLFNSLKNYVVDNNQENTLDQQSIAIYNQLEKMDIHEEIVRVKSHIKNLTVCIESSYKEKGKKIDFFLQELFREVTTIMAKCSDAIISSLTINIKVELEKMREQAQNIV
jgi:uncharacterized protein (TIGR00255 family)